MAWLDFKSSNVVVKVIIHLYKGVILDSKVVALFLWFSGHEWTAVLHSSLVYLLMFV